MAIWVCFDIFICAQTSVIRTFILLYYNSSYNPNLTKIVNKLVIALCYIIIYRMCHLSFSLKINDYNSLSLLEF